MSGSVLTSLVPISVRAYAMPASSHAEEGPAPDKSKRAHSGPDFGRVLVLDTETATDPSQRLSFGSARYFRLSKGQPPRCVQEVLFRDDELGSWYPEGLAVLERYSRSHRAEVVPGVDDGLRLYSRRDFLREVFYPAAYQARALVVGFNLPFDLARLAVDVRAARGRFRGGFSFVLHDYEAGDGQRRGNTYRPRIAIRTLDSKRSFIEFRSPWRPDEEGSEEADTTGRRRGFSGHFLDLRTLDFALTNEAHTLDRACELWLGRPMKEKPERHGVITPDYIDYNRADVRATAELAWALLEEFNRHVS